MKNKYLYFVAIMVGTMFCFGFSSCSSNDDINDFNFPKESLYGTWKISEVKMPESSTYTSWPMEETTATFNSDGTYSGRGYFGNGSGTYSAKGNTITTYVSGNVYIVYTVLSLNGSTAELKMESPNSEEILWIKCVKK
jgi:hypothetical protein